MSAGWLITDSSHVIRTYHTGPAALSLLWPCWDGGWAQAARRRQVHGLLVNRSAGLGTINIRYKLSNTLHYTHTYRHFTHTPGMRIGPVHDTGLSAVLWSSILATASIVAAQGRKEGRKGLIHTSGKNVSAIRAELFP